jgi:hypothetical protein
MASLVGAGVGLVAIVGVVWFVKGGFGDKVQVLTGKETDAALVAEWTGIAAKLGEEGPRAEAACATPPFLQIDITVDGHGKVHRAELPNWKSEAARVCVEKYLQTLTFPRSRSNTVRVAVSLTQ